MSMENDIYKYANDIFDRREFKKYLEYFHSDIRPNSKKIGAHFYRRAILSAQNIHQPRLAIDLANEALTIHPENVSILNLLGNLLFEENLIDESREVYQKVLEIDARNELAKIWLARVFRKIGDPIQEKKLYEELLDESHNEIARFSLGRIASENEDWPLALYYLAEIDLPATNPWRWHTKANALFYNGHVTEALDLLDKGMATCKDRLVLVERKIYFLNELNRQEESWEQIAHETNLSEREISLVKARTYRSSFNFNEAIRYYSIALDIAFEIPTTLDIVECLIQVGQEEQALERLGLIVHQMSATSNARFWNLYARLLDKANHQAWDQLLIKMAEVGLSVITLLTYVNILEEKNLLSAAIKFCQQIIDSPHQSMQVQIQAAFEKLRLSNGLKLRMASECDYEEEERKIQDWAIERLKSDEKTRRWIQSNVEYLDHLPAKGKLLSTRNNPDQAFWVAQEIVNAIENKRPFSWIRLGDGEGVFLPYPEELKKFKLDDSVDMQKVYFGTTLVNESDLEEIEIELSKSIETADILGIADIQRVCRVINVNTKEPFERLTRGILNVNRLAPLLCNDGQIVTSAELHQEFEMWGLYSWIFNHVESCNLITCHDDLPNALKARFSINTDELILLPPEFKWKSLSNKEIYKPHYPDEFYRICNALSQPHNGKIFLVAGGLLAKVYCRIIKENGGIALDIGSMADYWLGYQTRNFPVISNTSRISRFIDYFPNRKNYVFAQEQPLDHPKNRYLIAAAGDGVRWKNYLNRKKHLIEIGGETLVERTIRQIREVDESAEIILIGKDTSYQFEGAITCTPDFMTSALFNKKPAIFATRELWNSGGTTTLLFGDTFYSTSCIKRITELADTHTTKFIGRSSGSKLTGKIYGEIFAIRFDAAQIPTLDQALSRLNELHELNKLDRFQGWHLCRYLGKIPLEASDVSNDFIEIHDFTDDFDFPIDYHKWKEAVEKEVGPIEGAKVRDL